MLNIEYTIYTEFQLPTKSQSLLSDALVEAVAVGGSTISGIQCCLTKYGTNERSQITLAFSS